MPNLPVWLRRYSGEELYDEFDGFELSASACQELDEAGFTVVPGPCRPRTSFSWLPPMTQL